MKGIRGAITVEENTAEAIRSQARQMVEEILLRNDLNSEDIGAAIFSSTDDLTAAFPSSGARAIPGFDMVPLFDAKELAVDNALDHCIRVLLLVDTDKSQREIRHVYLGRAVNLRTDLITEN